MDNWIPCSERLPDGDNEYLVTSMNYRSESGIKYTKVTFVQYEHGHGWHTYDEANHVVSQYLAKLH